MSLVVAGPAGLGSEHERRTTEASCSKSTGLDDEALVLIEAGNSGSTSLEEVTRATASIDFGGESALIIRQPDDKAAPAVP